VQDPAPAVKIEVALQQRDRVRAAAKCDQAVDLLQYRGLGPPGQRRRHRQRFLEVPQSTTPYAQNLRRRAVAGVEHAPIAKVQSLLRTLRGRGR